MVLALGSRNCCWSFALSANGGCRDSSLACSSLRFWICVWRMFTKSAAVDAGGTDFPLLTEQSTAAWLTYSSLVSVRAGLGDAPEDVLPEGLQLTSSMMAAATLRTDASVRRRRQRQIGLCTGGRIL